MKVTYSVILLLVALSAAYCLPANKNDEKSVEKSQKQQEKPQQPEKPNKDVDFVPLEGQNKPPAGFPGVVDVDASGFFGNPFGNPFPSLFNSIEGMMMRLRQQLSQILGQLPNRPQDGSFPNLPFPNFSNVDLGKGNTTSVTKVIDGHKVTINETEYKQDGENGGAVFKVRIIDVHPDSAEVSTEKDAEAVVPNRDRESVEDSVNNEIPKTKDNEAPAFENIETFDEVDIVPPHKYPPVRRNPEWTNAHSVESIEDNSIDAAPLPHQYHDLSNDIYVNQLMADAGAPTNPDAEVFDVVEGPGPVHYYPQGKPEKILAAPMNYPQHEFEHTGVVSGPAFAPMPYYLPVNKQHYRFAPFPEQPMINRHFGAASEQIAVLPVSGEQNIQKQRLPTQEVSTASQASATSAQSTATQQQQSSSANSVPNVQVVPSTSS